MWNPFGSTKLPEDWKRLENEEQLNEIDAISKTKPVVIFKHSTSCSRSAFAKEKLSGNFDLDPEKALFYYLDLLSYRHISNAIAARYNVIHQSPQILIIKNGKSVFDTSHESIDYAVVVDRVA